ncbi:glycosyltransferase [Methanobacterium sp.]|uniref:glycosyltransferase n=1 Tax=Methanobacterium sp. TaxID=2164 RepID=UPI0031582334
MKILMITCTFPPRKFGGITRSSYNLANELVKRGHEVDVCTTDLGDDSNSRLRVRRKESLDGINVHYFRNISNYLAFNHRLFLPIGFISFIRENISKYDIIHVNDYRSILAVAVSYYSKIYNKPYILQTHGAMIPFFNKTILKKIFDKIYGKRILKDASKIIASTELEASHYVPVETKENIEIIPNPIELSDFNVSTEKGSFRKKYGLNNQKILLFLNRINKVKGIDLLLQSYAELGMNETMLVIVGPDDGYLEEINKLIKKLDIADKILYVGPLYGKEKLEAYTDANVYILPSLFESFGNTVVEALMCGTPVITTENCGNAYLAKKFGRVVKNDKNEINRAIKDILSCENYNIEEIRTYIENIFNIDSIMGRVECVYKNGKGASEIEQV